MPKINKNKEQTEDEEDEFENAPPIKKIKIDEIDDVHRTGARCIPTSTVQDSKEKGVNYHTPGVLRTKPGRGDPTISMSCSDKIAKWLVLGLQGALLSNLLNKPIYINGIITSRYLNKFYSV